MSSSGGRSALVLLLAAGAGCTFAGLGHYDVPRCDAPRAPTSFADDPCASLDGPSAGCLRFQCDVASGTCTLRPLDEDRDGDPALACGGHDCDDHDSRRYDGAPEVCDGVDNDCNGIADDGLVAKRTTRALLPLPSGFRDASLTSSNGKDLFGAAVVDDPSGQSSCIFGFRGTGEGIGAPCTFAATPGMAPRQPSARPIVAGDVTFGAAFVMTPDACPDGQLGYRSSKDGAVDASCVPGGASLPAFLPFADGKAIAVAYLGRAPSDEASCTSVGEAPLDVVWIDPPTATSTDAPPRVTANRLGLAGSLSIRPPALVPMGNALLLAAPADAAVGIWILTAPQPDGSGRAVVPILAPQDSDLPAARGASVALDGESRHLALVAEIGCPPAQRIAMTLVDLTAPGPVATVTRTVEVAAVSARAAAPRVAWLDTRSEWWVSWLGADGSLLLRRFTVAGDPAGPAVTASSRRNVLAAAPTVDGATNASAVVDLIDPTGLAAADLGCP